jgi:hypothetical protein
MKPPNIELSKRNRIFRRETTMVRAVQSCEAAPQSGFKAIAWFPASANSRRMKRNRTWIATAGGPHLLIAAEQLRHWRGIEQWVNHPADQSDYDRACLVTTWLGSIACNEGSAVVLSGEAGDIAWYPNGRRDEGFLVQWLGVDDERLIEPALREPQLRDLLHRPRQNVSNSRQACQVRCG